MDKRTLEQLSYYRLRDEVASFCVSEEGCDALKSREPFTDKTHIQLLKNYGREWLSILNSTNPFSLSSWPPLFAFLPLAKAAGASLSQDQLYALWQFAQSALKVQDSVRSASLSIEIPFLEKLCSALARDSISQAASIIGRVIDKNGLLKDLPEIRDIKAKIVSLHKDIERELKKYTSDTSFNTVLASNLPAFRADRQVLAVKASQKNRISGIVHEVSQSGQTLYIEPEEVVRKNNELVQEEFHLAQEIRKVFTRVTGELAPLIDDISSSLQIMITMDTTIAAAKWGIEKKAVFAEEDEKEKHPEGEEPSDSSELPPLLLRARHPLLGDKAVPIDIRFLEGKRVLIITGPNTGGKTVTLKTFALFCLLNQSGFPIPAAEGSRLPVFSTIFADIGDEQSIDQSLSTFSAHMKNIARAVDGSDSHSLILLDELGSGTDPQEGSAIAMSVLDSLIAKNAFVLVTTHHGVLKNYGYTNPGCVNASVDFDSDTLSPTYRLLMGVPGESHALDIAERSGLNPSVVAGAKKYLVNEQADVSKLIQGLTEKHAELAEREKEFEKTMQAQKDRQLKLDLHELRIRQSEHLLRERELRGESAFLAETRKQLENLVRILREGEINREKTLKVKQFIADLTGAVQQEEEELEKNERALDKQQEELEKRIAEREQEKEAVRSENGMLITKDSGKRSGSSKKKTKKKLSNKEALLKAKSSYDEAMAASVSGTGNNSRGKDSRNTEQTAKPQWVEGAEVFAGPSRSRGTLIRQEKKGVWTVQLGSIRMSIKQRDMVLAPFQNAGRTASVSVELSDEERGENAIFMKGGSQAKPVFELYLLGMRAEEAIKVLQRQLDLCSMQNFKTFSIVHGKGTGVLQQAVQDYLSTYPGVKEFHFARPEEGGFGKTFVTMN